MGNDDKNATPAAPTRQELAGARIALALHKIEEAQNLLYQACGDMSSIIGGVPTCNRVGKLADSVKAAWYKLANERERLTKRGIDRDYMAQYDDKVLREAAAMSPRGQHSYVTEGEACGAQCWGCGQGLGGVHCAQPSAFVDGRWVAKASK